MKVQASTKIFSLLLLLIAAVGCGDNKKKKNNDPDPYNRYQTLNDNDNGACSNYYDNADPNCSDSYSRDTSTYRSMDPNQSDAYRSGTYYDNYGRNGTNGTYPYYPNYNGSGYPYYPTPYDPRYVDSRYQQPDYYPSYGGGNFPFVCNYGTMCGFDPNIGRMPGPIPPYPYGPTPYHPYYDQCTVAYGGHCGNGQFYSGYLYHHGYASCHPAHGYCYPRPMEIEFNSSMYVPFY